MASCFKNLFYLSVLSLFISCGQDGKAPSPLSGSGSSQCVTCKIFVTTSTYDGNLGGSAGADAKCMSDSAKPSGGSTYKALIVDSARRACTSGFCSGGTSEHIDWVLKPNTQYTRPDGTVIATTTAEGVFSFNLTNSITSSGATAFTGLLGDWTNLSNCTDWTTNAGGGTPGQGNANDWQSIDIPGAMFCNAIRSLYCVEQ